MTKNQIQAKTMSGRQVRPLNAANIKEVLAKDHTDDGTGCVYTCEPYNIALWRWCDKNRTVSRYIVEEADENGRDIWVINYTPDRLDEAINAFLYQLKHPRRDIVKQFNELLKSSPFHIFAKPFRMACEDSFAIIGQDITTD